MRTIVGSRWRNNKGEERGFLKQGRLSVGSRGTVGRPCHNGGEKDLWHRVCPGRCAVSVCLAGGRGSLLDRIKWLTTRQARGERGRCARRSNPPPSRVPFRDPRSLASLAGGR